MLRKPRVEDVLVAYRVQCGNDDVSLDDGMRVDLDVRNLVLPHVPIRLIRLDIVVD
jgi:hypothetical protein